MSGVKTLHVQRTSFEGSGGAKSARGFPETSPSSSFWFLLLRPTPRSTIFHVPADGSETSVTGNGITWTPRKNRKDRPDWSCWTGWTHWADRTGWTERRDRAKRNEPHDRHRLTEGGSRSHR